MDTTTKMSFITRVEDLFFCPSLVREKAFGTNHNYSGTSTVENVNKPKDSVMKTVQFRVWVESRWSFVFFYNRQTGFNAVCAYR